MAENSNQLTARTTIELLLHHIREKFDCSLEDFSVSCNENMNSAQPPRFSIQNVCSVF